MGALQSKGFSNSMTIDEVYANPDILWETIADLNGIKSHSPYIQSIASKKNVQDDFNYETHNFRNYKSDASSLASIASSDNEVKVNKLLENTMGKLMMTEGMAWVEVKKFGKDEVKILKRVTSIETTRVDVTDISGKYTEQHELRSVRIHVSFLITNSSYLKEAAKTISFTVDSIISPSSSKIQNINSNGNDYESACENDTETISTRQNTHGTSSLSSTSTIAVPCRLIASIAFMPPPGLLSPLILFTQKIRFKKKYRSEFLNELTQIAKAAEKIQKQKNEQIFTTSLIEQ